jgi:hypothetical protein
LEDWIILVGKCYWVRCQKLGERGGIITIGFIWGSRVLEYESVGVGKGRQRSGSGQVCTQVVYDIEMELGRKGLGQRIMVAMTRGVWYRLRTVVIWKHM